MEIKVTILNLTITTEEQIWSSLFFPYLSPDFGYLTFSSGRKTPMLSEFFISLEEIEDYYSALRFL